LDEEKIGQTLNSTSKKQLEHPFKVCTLIYLSIKGQSCVIVVNDSDRRGKKDFVLCLQ
jgi:hypothetical protein